MQKIQVLLHGQILSELVLQPGREYFAGRHQQSDIRLSNEKNISRQHVKFYFDNNIWYAQLVAKFGQMICGGKSVDLIPLEHKMRFTVSPYEIVYLDDASVDIRPVQTENTKNPILTPVLQQQDSIQLNSSSIENANDEHNSEFEATVITSKKLVPYLRIVNHTTKTEEIFKLEGHLWSLGRHPGCEIVLNDTAISRKHFDITRSGDSLFIVDLGSSNGTTINGERIKPNQSTQIYSGDIITIRHLEMHFEMRDSDFTQNPLAVVHPVDEFENFDVDEASDQNEIVAYEESEGSGPKVVRIPPLFGFKRIQWNKTNQLRAGILGLATIFLISVMFSGGGKKDSPSKDPKSPVSLTEIQQKEVQDMFKLANSYFIQKKFVLCLSQIQKLHDIVPSYQNSKELENLCQTARELEEVNIDRERKEREQIEAESRIRSVVDQCKLSVNETTTVDMIRACLQPALELDPGQLSVTELITQVEIAETQRKEKLLKADEVEKLRLEGDRLYSKANSFFTSGKLRDAQRDYNKYLIGNYPKSQDKIEKSKRNLASINKSLSEILNQKIATCRSAMSQTDLKAAITACDAVLESAPNDQTAINLRREAYAKLKREMKAIYEDAALDESLGNIESAKERWMKIINTTIPSDEYFQKSKIKLKKYGIEI